VLRVAFDRQRGALPSWKGSPRHRGTSRSPCFRHCSSPLFLDVRGGAALALPRTQDRVGMIPRDWHRELKMTTLATVARRGGNV
jgi:hypothetical protein